MNGYQLTRRWFDFSFDKKEAKPQHTALYCWCVELNNRLGWKEEFGLPTLATMEGLSIGNKNTFLDTLKDLVEWQFIEVIQESKNQNSSRIIRLRHSENATADYTALDSAILQQCNNTDNGTVPIVKQVNKETIKPQTNKLIKTEQEFKEALKQYETKYGDLMIVAFGNYWTETDQKGKMRFEAQKFFDIAKRLATWDSKNKFSANTFVPLVAQANQTYYPPKPENDPILLRQEVHSNYEDYVRHCLKVNHHPEKPKYPELVPPDFDHIAFINQIKANL
jgi:hypothetical protein